MNKKQITLTDVTGIRVGHVTDQANRTGCTAILCPEGAAAGMELRGMAPGSRETNLFDPLTRTEEIHGILLTGGSAFGLAAASGAARWLAENGYGLVTTCGRVPLVPAAVIYDLFFNQSFGLPDETMGYKAASLASTDPVEQGCVGAGTGATAGKMAGIDRAMKTGLGSAGYKAGGIKVAALAVANPVGDVVDPETNEILAGVRGPDGKAISGTMNAIWAGKGLLAPPASNTVLGVVATESKLTKVQAARAARMAACGFARAVRPASTLSDGDMVFVLATGKGPSADENVIGALGAEALAQAIAAAARTASGIPGVPAYQDLRKT
ncbi:MAG: P1 family peptidase [Deltaproteobacteria bacterium]|nr:P1 family peptidase [Deltaproteobacteria bacterium]MBW2051384.1 P1 family peptidase [Deltaproteobacteria bacterium]MBW2141279.1 P1 family peptidase [Deltaproteobacteria bacterium]MBW2322731.1 P1 family peptidase [Deltaproteobacteria bacterium]